MNNIILNIAATGDWQSLDSSEQFPENCLSVTIKTRDDAISYYRYSNSDNYITINAGVSITIWGLFNPGDILIKSAAAEIFEIDCATNIREL